MGNRGGTAVAGGGGLTLADIPADAADGVASLRTLGVGDAEALSKRVADPLYDAAGTALALIAAGIPASSTVTQVAVRRVVKWAVGLNLVVGDVVIDPADAEGKSTYLVTKPHTTSGSFTVATQYNTVGSTGAALVPCVLSPAFKGYWVGQTNIEPQPVDIQGAWYEQGELVIAPPGSTHAGLLVQANTSHSADPAAGYVYDETRWTLPWSTVIAQTSYPGALMPPSSVTVINPQRDVGGFFTKGTRLRYDPPIFQKVLTGPTDFSNISGTGTIDQLTPTTTTPASALQDGSVRLRNTVSGVIALPAPMDMSAAPGSRAATKGLLGVAIRAFCWSAQAQRTNATTVAVDLFSDGSGLGSNFITCKLMVDHNDTVLPDSEWGWGGSGPADFIVTAPSAPVDVTHITHIRVRQVTTSAGHDLGVAVVQIFRNQTGKGRVCFTFDDNYGSGWRIGAMYLLRKGFRCTFFSSIGGAWGPNPISNNQISADELRMATRLGCQIGSHAFNHDHNEAMAGYEGQSMRIYFQRSRHASRSVIGGFGSDDFAWYGQLGYPAPTSDQMAGIEQNFRSGRLFINTPKRGEVLPPVAPHRYMAYGASSADVTDVGATEIAYATKAADQSGLAVYTWHDIKSQASGLSPDFYALVDWCDANRDIVDVLTVDEALADWAVPA